jgi:hypothetical protein
MWLSFCHQALSKRRTKMETSLATLPALAYIKDLNTWVVLNKNSEPLSWTEDAVEIAWLSEWVSQKGRDAETKHIFAKATTRRAIHFPKHLVPA